MSLFDVFKTPPMHQPGPTCVTVSLPTAAVAPSPDAWDYQGSDLEALEDALMEALAEADTGDFEENSFGDDAVLSVYSGNDADAMLKAMRPVLQRLPLGRKARLFVRDGSNATDPNGREVSAHA